MRALKHPPVGPRQHPPVLRLTYTAATHPRPRPRSLAAPPATAAASTNRGPGLALRAPRGLCRPHPPPNAFRPAHPRPAARLGGPGREHAALPTGPGKSRARARIRRSHARSHTPLTHTGPGQDTRRAGPGHTQGRARTHTGPGQDTPQLVDLVHSIPPTTHTTTHTHLGSLVVDSDSLRHPSPPPAPHRLSSLRAGSRLVPCLVPRLVPRLVRPVSRVSDVHVPSLRVFPPQTSVSKAPMPCRPASPKPPALSHSFPLSLSLSLSRPSLPSPFKTIPPLPSQGAPAEGRCGRRGSPAVPSGAAPVCLGPPLFRPCPLRPLPRRPLTPSEGRVPSSALQAIQARPDCSGGPAGPAGPSGNCASFAVSLFCLICHELISGRRGPQLTALTPAAAVSFPPAASLTPPTPAAAVAAAASAASSGGGSGRRGRVREGWAEEGGDDGQAEAHPPLPPPRTRPRPGRSRGPDSRLSRGGGFMGEGGTRGPEVARRAGGQARGGGGEGRAGAARGAPAPLGVGTGGRRRAAEAREWRG